LALLRGWLGDVQRFADGFHEYAQLEVPLEAATEAEALAQLVNPGLEDPQLDTVKLTYELSDVERLTEQLARDARVEDYAIDPHDLDEAETAKPRSTHILLDRPVPLTGVDIQRGDIPHVMAFLSVFGKRTDREARLEVTTDRGDDFDRVIGLLAEVTEDGLGQVAHEEVVAQKSISEESLSWRWRLPQDTPAEHRQQLLSAERRDAILDRWLKAPRAALQDQSPEQAASDPGLRIALLASALIIEQAAVDPDELPLFVELRERLQLPAPTTIDLATIDLATIDSATIDSAHIDLQRLPLVRIPRLDFAQLSETQLAQLLDRTVLMGAKFASLLTARALAGREVSPEVDLAAAYRQLIRLEPKPSSALEWAVQARQWSQARGQSPAEWTLMELELSIERGDAAGVQKALGEIRTAHLEEPGVAEATYRLLYAAGLVAPPDSSGRSTPNPLAPPDGASAGASAGAGGIWTPDSETPRAPEGEQKSVIWTP
jgi:hypothetical protein